MSINEKLRSQQNDELFTAILTLENTEECYAFFEDICTINELKALSQRLQVAKMLRAGDSYEKIVEETGASSQCENAQTRLSCSRRLVTR